jgi:hypothetical protein
MKNIINSVADEFGEPMNGLMLDEYGNKMKIRSLNDCKPNEIKNGLFFDDVGNKFWYKNNMLHNEKGFAMESINGGYKWYINGKLHREDGPAVVYDDGYVVWYLNGIATTEEEVMSCWQIAEEKKLVLKEKKLLDSKIQSIINKKITKI